MPGDGALRSSSFCSEASRMAIDARLSTRTARCGAADLADLVKYLHPRWRGIGLMVDLSIDRMIHQLRPIGWRPCATPPAATVRRRAMPVPPGG